MLSQDTKISEFNENQKSDKTPFIIYADPKCIIENNDGCKNNPEIIYNKSKQIYSIRFAIVYSIYA